MRKDIRLGMLPDPFIMRSGERVKSIKDWEIRRNEIIEDTIGLEFDGMPPKPEVFKLEKLDGRGRGMTVCYRIHCGTLSKDFTFCFQAYVPNLEGRMPVVLTGDAMYTENCNDAVIAEANRRGFIVVKFNRTELAPDHDDHKREFGINALWPELNFTAISAWAWGYHRVVDALMTLDFVDTEHIAITGHSRGGKTALLAGATDERIRYTNPNGSGTHGCGAYRFLQRENKGEFEDAESESLGFMFEAIPYWMGKGLKNYIGKEEALPHDTHFIKALIAPRCLLETNGYGDIWANPRGSYLSFLGAKEVWKMYNAEDKCAVWYADGGHKHKFNEFCALFDFIEADLYNKELPESIKRIPYNDMEPLHEYKCPEI